MTTKHPDLPLDEATMPEFVEPAFSHKGAGFWITQNGNRVFLTEDQIVELAAWATSEMPTRERQ